MGAGKYDFTKPEFQQLKDITATNNLANINFSTPDLGLTFSGTVKFNKSFTQYTDYIVNTSGITITASTVGAVAGASSQTVLIGDGTHTIAFGTNLIKTVTSLDYDNTLNKVNLVTYYYDGTRFWYSIIQS